MRALRFLPAALVASAILCFAASAGAADTAPDVVLLKNGGMVRGAIQELVPGQSVEIILADGSRRHYAASDVEYAGAAERMPAASARPTPSAAAPAPDASATRLRFEADVPDLRLHERSGTVEATVYARNGLATALGATYTDLCSAPCEPTLAPGQHTLAVSIPGRRPIEVPPVVVPPGASTLKAVYDSRAGVRVAGALLGLGSLVGGTVLIVLGAIGTTHQECEASFVGGEPFCLDRHEIDATLLVTGVALTVVGTVASFAMMSVGDHAALRIAPMTLRPLRTGLGPKREGADALGASGLGLSLAF